MILLYILLGLFSILALCMVAALIFFKVTVGRRDSWRMPEEKIIGDGPHKALLLYQPSNGAHNVPLAMALAKELAKEGYRVTVNHPSHRLTYNLGEYDLLLFGSPSYLGETSKALRTYIQGHPVRGKRIFLFVTGSASESPELEHLKTLIPAENEIHGIKVTVAQTAGLVEFLRSALLHTV